LHHLALLCAPAGSAVVMQWLLRCSQSRLVALRAISAVDASALARRSDGFLTAAAPVLRSGRARASATRPQLATLVAASGAAAGAAALFGFEGQLRPAVAHCDGAARHDVKVTTYNVLAPRLSDPSHFPKCPADATKHENRLPKLLGRMETETAAGAVIGLQEVDLLWAGKLHTFFAERDYVAVFAQYGNSFNGYMGVMLAWPREQYEALDVEISRISDTASKGTYPKSGSSTLTPFGMLTVHGVKEVIGCWPPDGKSEHFEWNLAESRHNEAIFVRLRPRGQPHLPSFCVSTYHMPCLFGPPEKVRVVNIHMYLLLKRLKDFAGSDPAVLMGDFNFKPVDSPYILATSGGSLEAARAGAAVPDELQGLKTRLTEGTPWPAGLGSAYHIFHGKEPLFTNFAQMKGMGDPFVETLDYIWFTPEQLSVIECPPLPQTHEEVKGPFPNEAEPSDHLPIKATLRLLGGGSAAGSPRSKVS